MKRALAATLTFVLVMVCAGMAHAQGLQTGQLQGTVNDSGGLVLPGVNVSVTSSALQGTRDAVTDANGNYVIRGLPAGEYTVRFELSSFKTQEQKATIELGQPKEVNATLAVAGVSESVQVTADNIASAVTTTTGGTNISATEVNALPLGRTLQNIALLSPGLSGNTPNSGQLAISGSFAYDNTFLVDGVDVNDNLFGNANALYIEDAVEQTQILTSGISAEYGRFSGGVVNAITKSGGDIFSGSYRMNLTNDNWTKQTPFEVERDQPRLDKVNRSQEFTVGGPILHSKVWFFGAFRLENQDTLLSLAQTGVQQRQTDDNKRGEIKITATPWQNHTVWGSYLKVSEDAVRPAFDSPDLATIDPLTFETPSFPNDGVAIGYRGVLSTRMFADVRYSEKKFGFRNIGGTSTNIVDSPFVTLTQAQLGVYNAPYFDATDPEDRDNWQVAGNLSYYLTTGRAGSHDFKGGLEVYQTRHTGGNSQSASNYVFDADYATDAAGEPVYDSNNRLIPVFTPNETLIENWLATRGAEQKIRTTSLYAQDQWKAGRHFTFNLGLRYEHVRSDSTGGIIGVDTDTVVPRLAATYDPKGDGRYVLQATYGHYAGKYSESQFGNNTNVGNPDQIIGVYSGPAGQGRDFAPGFNPANYETVQGTFPTANVFFDKGLSSPITKEFTLQAGAQLNPKTYAKVVYTHRSMSNFVEDFIDTTTGQTDVVKNGIDFGDFDNRVYRNSDIPQRKYDGLYFQGQYRINERWLVEGNWTVQVKNEGNFEGEAANTPAVSSNFGNYPEILTAARNFPIGNLAQFQRNRMRLWTIYTVPFGRFGSVDAGVIWRYDSPRSFSLAATGQPLTDIQEEVLKAFGYASAPSSQTIFFGDRGTGRFKGANQFDLSLSYGIPVFKTLRPWLKAEIVNLFNEQTLGAGISGFRTTVQPDFNGPVDNLGLPLNFTQAPTFGNALNANSYPIPRTFRMAFGVRF
jgi:outer membrane receptor protein involved in Fe transport